MKHARDREGLEAVDDHDVGQVVTGTDLAHAMDGPLLNVGRGHHQDDHRAEADDLFERGDTVLELGMFGVDGSGVVIAVGAARLAKALSLGPIGGDDDCWVHGTTPFLMA